MRGVHQVVPEGMVFTDRAGLYPLLGVPVVGGQQNVGGREERGKLVAVKQVTSVQMVLLIEGVVDSGNELLIEVLAGNGVLDVTANVGSVGERYDWRQIFQQGQ